ncbi:MAG: MotA/TolQ/ExbB proton channel family protein [Deltaproteobacteria bacterium]|nr:MotA/TolQ/ExbB proton channel family protein [Candidatus Zymogenaceae bacterium]
MKSFLDFIISGGPLMIPIILCSVIALGVFLERLFYLRRKKNIPEDLLRDVEDLLKTDRVNDVLSLLRRDRSPMARIFLAAMKNYGKSRETIKVAVEEIGGQEAEYLNKYVVVLSVIAQVSPLLGLLGTVQGMIQVFNKVVSGSVADPSQMAGGISVALITTAGGLTVAIPALIGYHYLLGKANDLILDMQQYSIGLVELIKGDDGGEQP